MRLQACLESWSLVFDPPCKKRKDHGSSPPRDAPITTASKDMARQRHCPKALRRRGTVAIEGRQRRRLEKQNRHESLAENWLAFLLPPSPGQCFWCQRLMIENSPWFCNASRNLKEPRKFRTGLLCSLWGRIPVLFEESWLFMLNSLFCFSTTWSSLNQENKSNWQRSVLE